MHIRPLVHAVSQMYVLHASGCVVDTVTVRQHFSHRTLHRHTDTHTHRYSDTYAYEIFASCRYIISES